jgi:hypothetical protein
MKGDFWVLGMGRGKSGGPSLRQGTLRAGQACPEQDIVSSAFIKIFIKIFFYKIFKFYIKNFFIKFLNFMAKI